MDEASRKPYWIDYLEHDVIGQAVTGVGTVYEVLVKIRPGSLFAVVKARGGGGYYVAFVGGKSLSSLSGEIRRALKSEKTRWKPDQYAKT